MKVEARQILATLDASNVTASLRLAESQLESAKAMMNETKPNLHFAMQELKRFTELAATKAVSDSDLRRRESEARALEAHLARQEAEIAVAESEVASWKQQLDDTVIRAPFGGIVTSKNAQPGEMISPMSSGGFTRTGICTIVDMTSLEIDVDVTKVSSTASRQASPSKRTSMRIPTGRSPRKSSPSSRPPTAKKPP